MDETSYSDGTYPFPQLETRGEAETNPLDGTRTSARVSVFATKPHLSSFILLSPPRSFAFRVSPGLL